MRKLKFRKLEIKFGNRNFEELFENGILGKLNFEYWNLGMEFREIKEIEILKIYYENGISKNQILKVGILKNYFENRISEN